MDFGHTNLKHRLLHGGLPPFFLAKDIPERDFQEWLDSYWSKDIQELFRVEKRHSFLKFFELLMGHAGGMFEASTYARPCEVSRPTITSYLHVLEATHVLHVVRPFHSGKTSEIVAAPRVFAFDTGFVCYYRGWQELRKDDLGPLLEHLVVNELHSGLQTRDLHYWRDKRGHEIDFVMAARGRGAIAIECKWSADAFDPTNLRAFRTQYPRGENLVVAQDVDRAYSRTCDGIPVRFLGLGDLVGMLQ